MGRIKWAVAVLLLATLLVGCTQMSAEEIAKKVEEKYNQLEDFRGVQRIVVETNGVKHTQEYEFAFKKPNKVRMYNKEQGLLIVSNGKTMWSYDEKNNEVFVMELKQPEVSPDYGKLVKNMMEYYDVELLGSEKVLGRDCYVLKLTPKEGSEFAEFASTQKMWIDKEYWYPLKTEMKGKDMSMTMEYTEIEFNTGVSDDVFEFTPPEGAKIKTPEDLGIREFSSVEEAQQAVDFEILEPSYTAGYELRTVTVIKDSVSMQYVNGQDIMFIREVVADKLPEMQNAEKVKVGDTEGTYIELYGSGMLTFRKGDIVVTITGKLDKEELIKIAESME
ncbi:outer membrane lipoprotein-sorting protein [Archaeoglobus veneficus]|uniref:Outer membrane lipoprotein carrier protein LolA n=1 Tax=Archaeoglobus veneficus (strain DSM 11195 / SNP6) TaxID=693661 RepID=F2KRC9_ARCVS|nr:outer membrane lipoprotein-sorting protein [Archaeoglobus veneficus]AEA47863.1 outer membrane lipoprotein carrier protein LolA [Archaeoglobus veneficus SNP6]